jgi:predicted transcriptional regulator
MQASDIIISIKPSYVEEILAGRKTVELRRRFPECLGSGGILWIYATKPEQSLIGAARVKAVRRMSLGSLWRSFGEQARVPKSFFNEYFSGAREGFGVVLGSVVRFEEAISVSELRERFRFSPPQSYRYIRGHLTNLLHDERIQVPDRHKHRDRSGGQPPSRGRAH